MHLVAIDLGPSIPPIAGFAVRGEMGAKDGVVSARIIVGDDEMDAPTTTGAAEAAQDTIDWWNRHTGTA